MNKDIRVSVTLPTHPKIVRMMRELGDRSFYNLIRFWTFVSTNKPDGDLAGMDDIDIEIAVDWQGDHGRFVAEMIKRRFIDERDGRYVVHDWLDHNEFASHAPERSEKARKAARKKWEKWRMETDKAMLNSACSNATSRDKLCPSPSPSPSPSLKKPRNVGAMDKPPSAPAEVFLNNKSKHFRSGLENVLKDIKQSCDIIVALPIKRQMFNPYQAVQKAVNEGMHPEAIKETLGEMARYWDTPRVKTPWGWWRKVIEKNSQNRWEKEEIAKAEEYKQAITEAVNSDLFERLGLKIKTLEKKQA